VFCRGLILLGGRGLLDYDCRTGKQNYDGGLLLLVHGARAVESCAGNSSRIFDFAKRFGIIPFFFPFLMSDSFGARLWLQVLGEFGEA
jgi:hypothetical protein